MGLEVIFPRIRGATSHAERPRATIDPDTSKTWLRRVLPLVLTHKLMLAGVVIGSFVALTLQVLIPNVIRGAIDDGLIAQDEPLGPYVATIVGLASARWVTNGVSRYLMFSSAFRLEYDLRTLIYEHLSRLSFPFYDRVQSGQLISRANSDIRSVQMYLAFAPTILAQCAVALVAFGIMLTINVPLAFVAMSTLPIVFVVGGQDAPPAVPRLVARPVPTGRGGDSRRREHQRRAGRQVLRRRAATAPPAGDRGKAHRVGQHRQR